MQKPPSQTKKRPDIPLVILAGGEGARMRGAIKCLLQLGNQTILKILTQRFHPAHPKMYLSLRNADTKLDQSTVSEYGLTVIEDDTHEPAGPLAGIYSAAKKLEETSPFFLTIPGDCPFLPEDLVNVLWGKHSGDEDLIVFAKTQHREHVLTAIWPTTIWPNMLDALKHRQRSVVKFIQSQNHQAVLFDSKNPDSFFNINTLEQYQRAQSFCS